MQSANRAPPSQAVRHFALKSRKTVLHLGTIRDKAAVVEKLLTADCDVQQQFQPKV